MLMNGNDGIVIFLAKPSQQEPWPYAPDAKYIATFDPELVGKLLDRIEELEREDSGCPHEWEPYHLPGIMGDREKCARCDETRLVEY